MPRDITRTRSSLGGSGKTAPKVKDVDTQRAVNEIYKELNVLSKAVNSSANLSQSVPSEGKDGDIRLFTDVAADGTRGYFVQGKFGDSWASGRLSFDSIDPMQKRKVDNVSKSYEDDGGGYITQEGVTYENLDSNNDVGILQGQVAKGNHNHEHQTLNGAGTNDHATIDTHLGNADKHRLASDDSSKYINTVSSSGNSAGDDDAWARANHVHTLNQGTTYTFTAKQNIDLGNSTTEALYVRGESEFVGDVTITGDLVVDLATDGGGDADITGDLDVAGFGKIGTNVFLNDKSSELSNNVNDTSTTTIHGKTFHKNSVEVLKALGTGEKHLTIASDNSNKLDMSVSGTGVVNFEGNNAFRFNQSLEPEVTMTKSLGSQSKKWLSIHAGELIVENLVAQDVMATIGGRILVAPTAKIALEVVVGAGFITTDSDIFNTGDIAYLQSAPGGVAQVEAMRITSESSGSGPYIYTVTRNVDGSGANVWSVDDAVVNLGHEQGDGFIDLTATQSVYENEGPMIGLFARGAEVNNVLSDWNVPEIARLGNLSGTGYTGDDDFGIMIGKNLAYSQIHETYPFTGMIGNKEGVKLYNTDLSLYDGDDLTAFVGMDDNNKPVMALGNDMGSDFSGASLLYSWDQSLNNGNGRYKLALSNTDVDLGVDITISENSIITAMPWFTADPGNLGDATRGLYLSNQWLGFYENPEGNGANDVYWPIIVGSTGSGETLEPFFEIKDAATNPTNYLRYTVANGLELSGKVNIIGEQPPVTLNALPNLNYNISNNGSSVSINYQLPNEAATVYVHFKGESLFGSVIEWTNNVMDEPSPNWSETVLTGIIGSGWFTAEISHSGSSAYRAFRIRSVSQNNSNTSLVKAAVVTKYRPGDPQAIIDSTNSPDAFYEASAPTGSFNVGDQWFDTDDGNNLYVWNGTTWEPTFTAIDGAQITTGTIKGVALESIETISDGSNNLPRVKLDLGGSNSLKQYNTGMLPNRYTELDGGVLKYVHEGVAGEGVQNSSNPLTYELPMAMQLIRANDLNLGTTFTFNSIGLQSMYSADYQVIPINETQIVTGQQSVSDLNTTGGIAREYLEYEVSNKTAAGFKMRALLYRGQHRSLVSDTTPTSYDYEDNLFNNNNTNYGDQTTGGVFNPSNAPQPHSDFFEYDFDLSGNKYTYTEGITNSNLIGGANKFNVKFTHGYSELVYQEYSEWLGSTYYPGFPGTTYVYYMLRVGDGTGSPFANDGSFFTVTPVGFGGDVEDDNLKFTLVNEGQDAFSYGGPDVSTWPSGSDNTSNANYFSIPKSITRYVQFNSPDNNLIVNPRVELVCFFHRRENSGSTGGYGYHSPTIKDSGTTDDVTLNNVYQGQVPELVEELTGTGYTGAIVSKWNNISTGEPI